MPWKCTCRLPGRWMEKTFFCPKALSDKLLLRVTQQQGTLQASSVPKCRLLELKKKSPCTKEAQLDMGMDGK